ncbi:uncharacterized protein LOC130768865 [Actinidia eriantha]|uniref:uncharacterized protein LOC130768865 n=1 Tax=Actinidia eriantha TaxID=165200 RepID=UPI00258C6BF7|nr:uncharacterized protein LOC130768865 [Actinidia eriantha]
MAADVCSEISNLVSSPRISFSQDLRQPENARIDGYHRQSDLSLSDPNFDFHFCISKSFNHELSSADELFSNGKILPIQIKNKKKPNHSQRPITKIPTSPNNPLTEDIKKKRLKEFLLSNFEEESKPSPKSFWQFKRSTSLNFSDGQGESVIRSLQFLSRSNSTGSGPNPKQNEVSKDYQKRHWFKQVPGAFSRSFSSSTLGYNSYYYPYNSSKRPPLKKNCRSYYGDGVRVSPVLNIPHNCIAIGTVSLFGFGSFFCNGKAKKKEK